MVVSSNEPLLFMSDDLRVIAASTSFCRAFEIDPASVTGKRYGELGRGEWAIPKLESLLRATATGSASIDAYEIDLNRPDRTTRQLVVNARRFDDGDLDHVRLLLAVTDVTDVPKLAGKTSWFATRPSCCRKSNIGSPTVCRYSQRPDAECTSRSVGGSPWTSPRRPSPHHGDRSAATTAFHIRRRQR